jgi:type III restriction enzyme
VEHLYERLAVEVGKWRANGYPTPNDRYPAIAEILEWAGDADSGGLRYLRRPQLMALETYWFIRLLERTPHIFDLYRRFWPPVDDRKASSKRWG